MMKKWVLAMSPAAVAVLATSEPASAEQVRERVTVELAASGIAASGKSSDGFEDADKSGGVFAGEIGYTVDKGDDHLAIDVSSAYFAYTDEGRKDRWSNGIAASYGRDLGSDIRLTTLASFDTQLSTLESSSADQAQLRGRLAYAPGPHRFRITGGWRWRDYRDLGGATGDGLVATVDYRYRIAKGQSVSIAARYEEIDSNSDRRDYRRYIVTGGYGFRLGSRTAANIGVQWRNWTYAHRLVGGKKRHDHSIAPQLGIEHDLGDDWFIDLDGTIIDRGSNDDRYDETVKRAMLTVRKRFRL